MEWNSDEMLRLIQEYRKREVLWDLKFNNITHKKKKDQAWGELAALFDTDYSEIRRKVNSLLASYRRERQKMNLKRSYRSKWFAYSSLSFLNNRNNKSIKAEKKCSPRILWDDADILEPIANEEDPFQIETTERQIDLTTDEEQSQLTNDRSLHRKLKKSSHYSMMYSGNNGTKSTKPALLRTALQDSCAIFGEYISSKLRGYDKRTSAQVQRAISDIIFSADMGEYERPNSDNACKELDTMTNNVITDISQQDSKSIIVKEVELM